VAPLEAVVLKEIPREAIPKEAILKVLVLIEVYPEEKSQEQNLGGVVALKEVIPEVLKHQKGVP